MTIAGLGVAALATGPAANATGSGAGYTSVDVTVDGTGHCLNNGSVNCNIYDGKEYVWMNGGPVSSAMGDGSYFFVVLNPSGQTNPNDGSPDNLSSPNDAYTNRTFSVSGGTVTYSGSHDFDAQKIRLMPYNDTANNGGVYVMAICSLADGYPVKSSDCKYDAFKVLESGSIVPADAPTIVKDADGSYTNTYAWDITKDVDKTIVKQTGGSATFNYTVTVTHDGGTVSGVQVGGTISVFNPNVDAQNATLPIDIDGVTDKLSDGTVCTVTNGGAQALTQFQTNFAYSCDLSGLPQGELDNTATVTWSDQFLDDGSLLTGGSADFTFTNISFAENAVDECANVTDSYAGTLGTVCVGDANPTTFNYSRTIPVQPGCVSYDNTASFTSNDTGATGSASQTVTLCGPAQTGALTIGFWKTTNGQNLIKTYCQSPTGLGAYLRGLGGGSGPYSNAPDICKDLATYVSGVLSGATASNMNVMLRAQMLGTALDVWYSGPGWTSTALNKIKPPSNFLSHNNLGTFQMDLTAICPMVDNTTTGSASCTGSTPSTDGVASGAFPSSPMTMQALLDFESTTPSPFNGSTSTPVWYAGNRTLEEIAKNAFDQFNNQLAFGSF